MLYTSADIAMPKLKSFCKLSRRQRNRRVNNIENDKYFINENMAELDEQVIPKSLLVEESCNNSFEFVTNHDNSSSEYNNASSDYNNSSSDNDASSSLCHKDVFNNDSTIITNEPNITDISIFFDEEYCASLATKEKSFQEKLMFWADEYNIEQNSLTALLNILKSEGHKNLPYDGRTLMKTPRSTIIHESSGGHYFHYGLQNAIIDQLKRFNVHKFNNPIVINVNIDGLPISKSSKSQLWPILAQICLENPTSPFIIGAYHGCNKPNTDNFLQHFVTEFQHLNTVGFMFHNETYQVQIRAIICDSPARAFVTCTKSHNGYFGCSKCIVEGDYENHRMLFLDENCSLRTDDTFKFRQTPEHHTGVSLLEQIPLPMVTAFPLDYMHLICLGQMKKLLSLWLRGPTYIEARLSAGQIKSLTADMISLKRHVCSEFVRIPINLEELDRWKATEFRVFLLYLAPVLLYKYLPYNCLKHFMAFHSAIRILCHPQDYLNNNNYAKELLLYFVRYYKILYGKENMIYTVHSLIHLSNDAKQFGPLDTFSAFPFENHLHNLKMLLRKHEKPLQQIHRRIAEKNIINTLKINLKNPHYPILVSRNKKNLPFGCSESYDMLKFSDFKLSCEKADRFCYLRNNKVIIIHHIGVKDGNPVILGQEYKEYCNFDIYPCDSRLMHIFIVGENLTELKYFFVNEILRKAVLLPWVEGKHCVLPLLHSDTQQSI